jgi:glycine hydroxymethyltransferase
MCAQRKPAGLEPHPGYFSDDLAAADPEVAAAVADELVRQQDGIELIASENLVSRAVLEVQGSVFTNKTVEGYPGGRYYGGAAPADAVERLAIERATQLFGCRFANVQPHSGSQANQAVYLALLEPGQRIPSMALPAGGHLSHGATVNLTGKWFDVVPYGVRRQDGIIDYDEVAGLAQETRPKLIIAGGSAYPRLIDFARFREIADSVGAWLLVDMAHFAGLVAGGVHPSPVPYADVVTTTTYKSLRGPRGGVILCNDEALAKRFDQAVFPGLQGSVLLHTVAAKAVCLGEALRPEFRDYARRSLENARALAAVLAARGHTLVGGGTDTSLLLLDLQSTGPRGLTGDVASESLENAGLTCNKNAVPFDPQPPRVTSGLRLSSAVGTTRGFGTIEFEIVGGLIADVLSGLAAEPGDNRTAEAAAKRVVADLCQRFPIYPA